MEFTFDFIADHMPDGWREKAKELKAFTRVGDYIKTPDDLLRILLLWADMGSLGETSAFLKGTGDFPLNKNALFERVEKSADWLEWMVKNYLISQRYLVDKPDWLKEFRVLLTDATTVSKPGSQTIDYRLHDLVELFTLRVVEHRLTGIETGETIKNFSSIGSGDLIIGDRAYGTLSGVMWVKEHEADYIFRWKANSFTLYRKSENGELEKYDLTSDLQEWEENKIIDLDLYAISGQQIIPVRVCAKGKTKEAIEAGLEKIKQSNSGDRRKEASELQKTYNKFVVVITSLSSAFSAEQILSLYRMRWQIELVFKRMKSIFHYDQLKAKNDRTARAWLYCALLLAALCETVVQNAEFSPCGQNYNYSGQSLVVERIKSCLRCS